MNQRFRAVPIIIALNFLVYLMWNLSDTTNPSFMTQNFLVSWTALLEGRYWTLITSVFSHVFFWHILLNMLVLNSFGTIMEEVLGIRSFLKFYFVAGIFSSLSHSLVSAAFLRQPELPALGASGAISGLVLVFSFLFPKQKILIFGIIPVPALWGALGFVGWDIWGLISQAEGGSSFIGHGAHLGGAFTGITYYFLFLRTRWLELQKLRAWNTPEGPV